MSVCCDYCVLSGRGLCDGLITRPEESYRVCVSKQRDREASKTEVALAPQGALEPLKKESCICGINYVITFKLRNDGGPRTTVS
jgi:hypothetical protein